MEVEVKVVYLRYILIPLSMHTRVMLFGITCLFPSMQNISFGQI